MSDRAAPPFIGDPSALVIVDWSWWLNKAFRLQGVEGMTSCIVGWLAALLSYDPAHVCLALDSHGETWRHRMRHPTDDAWRYKAGRDPKPEDFYTLSRQCTEIAELHGIPALWADGYEADDVFATVVRKARAAGYRVWMCSADKDLCGLVEDDPHYGILVGMWDNSEGTARGPDDVMARFGVTPGQVADLLAIGGDASDNIPGVRGLGLGGFASKLLGAFGTLENALASAPEDIGDLSTQIKSAEKAARKAPEHERDAILEVRAGLMQRRRLAKLHATLLASADVARFSRLLTALDCDAPVDVPWYDLPTGGYQADALRVRYEKLGYSRKAAQVTYFKKRPPYAVGL